MSGDGQPMWNTVVPVIANLRATSARKAEEKLRRALSLAGFDVYENTPGTTVSVGAFEAEAGTTESVMPMRVQR